MNRYWISYRFIGDLHGRVRVNLRAGSIRDAVRLFRRRHLGARYSKDQRTIISVVRM